ncbi:MAG: hypothetical protein VB092_07375 [Oscillospiraceae bacterium]|nr:hypothetical protein [Oscillospiraceae bacterium]
MYIVSIADQKTGRRLELTLPLTEYELDRQLTSAGVEHLADVKIDGVRHTEDIITLPEELSPSTIFELNILLAKLERHDEYWLNDFSAAVKAFDFDSAKELINLTYDIEYGKYVFCRTADNRYALGKWYVEHEGGIVSPWVEDNLDYESLGRDLDKYEFKGKFCDSGGYVYLPKHNQIEDVYDGLHLPLLHDNNESSTSLCYENEHGAKVFLSLPAGPLMWQELYRQMDNDSTFTLTESVVLGQCVRLDERTDVEELNRICERIKDISPKESTKLKEVFEYANSALGDEDVFTKYGAKNTGCHERLRAIYEHLGDFDFIPNVVGESGLAWYLVKNKFPNFEADEGLWSYIDYDRLGHDWHEIVHGRFTGSGYVIDETPPEQTLTEGELKL